MKLSIIIPTHNEEKTILRVLHSISALTFPKEIIVVVDHSGDGTLNKVQRFQNQYGGLRAVIRKEATRGKGLSVREGLKYAQGDYVLIHDADIEYNPEDIYTFVEIADKENVPVIYGSRFLNQTYPRGMALKNFLANKILTFTANRLYSSSCSDEAVAYKMLKTPLMRSLKLTAEKFELCAEITAKLGKRNIPIREVPVRYTGRKVEDGKKIRWTDGIHALFTLLKYRLPSQSVQTPAVNSWPQKV